MKPWLVFFDIDGTLLFPNGISPRNTAAIAACVPTDIKCSSTRGAAVP